MRTLPRFILALFMVLTLPLGANADPTIMRFATLSPPNWWGVTKLMQPWAEKVKAASEGTLDIQLTNGFALGNYTNVYDRVLNDFIQISWGSPSYMGGLFPKTDVVALPFIGDGSERASVALWHLYAGGLISDEFKSIKPLGLFVPPQSGIHTRKTPIHALADLEGLRIRAGSKALNEVITALGATPNSINVGEVYTALQRGTIDGTILPWTAFQAFKLQEVTFDHLDVQLGSAPLMIFMSQAKFDALPPLAKKAIDDNSGEMLSRTMGKLFDEDRSVERQSVVELKDHTITTLASEELERWKAKVQPVSEAWGKSVPEADKVLAAYTKEMQQP